MSTTHVKPVVVTDSTGAILAKIEEKKRIAKADYGKYLRLKMPVMKQDSVSCCTTCVALFDIMETNRTREMFLLDVLQHAAIDSGELSTKVKTRETTCAALNEQVQCLISERDEARESIVSLINKFDEQLKLHKVRELEYSSKYNLMMACNKWLFKNARAGYDSKTMKDAVLAESDEVLRMALTEMCIGTDRDDEDLQAEDEPEVERIRN